MAGAATQTHSAHTFAMALKHLLPMQPVDIHSLDAGLAGAKSVALFKSEQLEVIRLVLPAGKSLPSHRVDGEITVQCLEGQVDIEADGRHTQLRSSQMLYLQGGVTHSIVASSDSSLLLTVVLRG